MSSHSPLRALASFTPVLVALTYLLLNVGADWIPGDEGLLGQTAVRVLAGDMPHREFVDPYTGLLSLYHAFIFDFCGRDLINLRWALFVATIPFTYCLYRSFCLFLSPQSASWATAGTLVGTLPAYFAALPSWYLLFLSAMAFYLIIRWIDLNHASLLIAAGTIIGLAAAVKITGLLLLYAAVLSIAYATSNTSTDSPRKKSHDWASFTQYLLSFSLLAIGLIGSFSLIWPRLSGSTFYLFIIPTATVCIAPALSWIRNGAPPIKLLIRNIALIAIGFLLVWVPFLTYIALHGDLYLWWVGVFVTPRLRLELVAQAPPDLMPGILVIITLGYVARRFSSKATSIAACVGASCVMVVALFGPDWIWSRVIWRALLVFTPLVVVRATARAVSDSISLRHRSIIFATASWAAFWNMNKYPYTGQGYLLYSIPAVLVCWASSARETPGGNPLIARAIWGSVTATALLGQLPRYIPFLPLANPGSALLEPLALPGASLLVSKADAARYQWLVAAIDARVPNSSIIAFPHLPEIYYLSGRINPTPYIYEVLGEPGGGGADLRRYLRDDRTRAFVTYVSTLEDAEGMHLKKVLQETFTQHESAHGMTLWWR